MAWAVGGVSLQGFLRALKRCNRDGERRRCVMGHCGKTVSIMVVGLGLTACQSASPPSSAFQALGPNTYAVTSSSTSPAAANALALQNAQRLCQSQGKQSQTQTGHAQFLNSIHQFVLEFTCV